MDYLLGINSYTPIISYNSNGTISPTTSLLASELSLATPGFFNNTSTAVTISGTGQLLSAATIFQNQLKELQPGTATSGGGQNFGTDFASLAAEAQNLVDAYNSLQDNIASIYGNNLLGGNIADASVLAQSLNSQALANYANGNSVLTNLSQLGIIYQPSLLPGGSGSLNIDLTALQSAYDTDASGAFSLLANAANALAGLAGSFVTQQGSSYLSLATLLQTSTSNTSFSDFLSSNLLSQAQSSLSGLLSSGSLSGNANIGQLFQALNEYSMVSTLFA